MEGIPFTRVYLESLATGDLIKMADALGLDMPDNPDRTFIIEELLDASSRDETGTVDSPEPGTNDPVLVEAAPLSRRYNISFMEVMIRDPLWAFVFWEIKTSDEEQFEKAHDFTGYYQKISPIENPDNPAHNESEGVFKIPVKREDTARYLGLTNTAGDGIPLAEQCQYKVEFCAGAGGVENVLAVSSPVRLPWQPVTLPENQLARLSGYGDFHVIRKSERALRAKGQISSNE